MEEYNALAAQQFDKADGAMFVYGIDSRSSFQRIAVWRQQVLAANPQLLAGEMPAILVGNKVHHPL